MISRLTEVEVETADEGDGSTHRLDDAEIAGFATLLAAAGSETVTKLVGNGVVLFARHPDEWRKLLDDPDKGAGAVEEVLRYWAPSQYQGRFTHRAAEFHGVTIPEGVPVFLVTGAANRDEREYDDPDRFDIDREQGLGVGLGHGIHSCLGAALARLESRVAFDELRDPLAELRGRRRRPATRADVERRRASRTSPCGAPPDELRPRASRHVQRCSATTSVPRTSEASRRSSSVPSPQHRAACRLTASATSATVAALPSAAIEVTASRRMPHGTM